MDTIRLRLWQKITKLEKELAYLKMREIRIGQELEQLKAKLRKRIKETMK